MPNTASFVTRATNAVRKKISSPSDSPGRQAPGPDGILATIRATREFTGDFLSIMIQLAEKYAGPEMAPVAFNVMGQQMYLLTDPVQIHHMLFDNDRFTRTMKYMNAFKRVLGYNIITAPNSAWKPLRHRTVAYFAPKHLDFYGSVFVRVLHEYAIPTLTEKARRGEAVDLFSEVLDIASIAVFMSFLGDEIGDPPREVYQALNRLFCYIRSNMYTLFFPPLWVPTAQNRALNADLERLRSYLRPRITSDRDRATMLGDIIRANSDERGRPNVQRILDETISNLVGGSETTIVLMAWAMFYVAQHKDVQARLRREIDEVVGDRRPTNDDLKKMPYLRNVVSETLRLRSPAYMQTRTALKDTELGGYTIKKDAMIFASQYITHQDARFWKDPGEFRPERFNSDSAEAPANRKSQSVFFPFGGGAFYCVGMNYAFYEAELTLLSLLQHFEFDLHERTPVASVGHDARITLRPDRPIFLAIRERSDPAKLAS